MTLHTLLPHRTYGDYIEIMESKYIVTKSQIKIHTTIYKIKKKDTKQNISTSI